MGLRWVGRMAGLLPVLVAGAQLVLGTASPAHHPSGFSQRSIVSSPRESLPSPVHDEATCAFCQAAAFAPHSSRAVGTIAIAIGDERRVHLSHENHLAPSASASPARSRAPPVTRSV